MSDENDVVQGALKLTGLLEECCFTNWQDFVQAIPKLFSVEVPPSITNVIVSPNQPRDDQRDNVWFRTSSSGSFVGVFIYAQGQWRMIWPVPSGIYRMYGNSNYIPPGYMLADTFNPHLSQSAAQELMQQWVLEPIAGAYYVIFDVTYEGF